MLQEYILDIEKCVGIIIKIIFVFASSSKWTILPSDICPIVTNVLLKLTNFEFIYHCKNFLPCTCENFGPQVFFLFPRKFLKSPLVMWYLLVSWCLAFLVSSPLCSSDEEHYMETFFDTRKIQPTKDFHINNN